MSDPIPDSDPCDCARVSDRVIGRLLDGWKPITPMLAPPYWVLWGPVPLVETMKDDEFALIKRLREPS